MIVRESTLKVVDLPIERLRPNGWNVNKMDTARYEKLKRYLERERFLEPIVARPVGPDTYEIIGGEHRWRAAQELGYSHIPCAVVELNDKQARIASINLNELAGAPAPDLLAHLIHELSRDTHLSDLATWLPYDEHELQDLTDLLKIPDGLEEQLAADAERMERERPRVLSFAVSAHEERVIEAAIELAKKETGVSSRGRALLALAESFISGKSGGVA
jgi:ParB/RepB/Spo0J family partition protein